MDRSIDFSYKHTSYFTHAQVAQLVEHSTENAGVGCSIQPLGTTFELVFYYYGFSNFLGCLTLFK